MTKYSPVRIDASPTDKKRMAELKGIFRGERCFIVGNGPSLNKHDLSKLKNEKCFGVNSIFYKTELEGFKPTFYTVEDSHVLDDNLDSILDYDVEYKFLLAHYADKVPEAENTYFVSADLGFYRESHPFGGVPRFSRDAADVVFAGQSVTLINLQLAYHLGFKNIYLIGMDFYYEKPKSVITKGLTWISTEDDPNHFDPRYFGAGKKWHDPQLDKVAVNYSHAKKVLERNKVAICNASIGGKLEIFDRVDFESLF